MTKLFQTISEVIPKCHGWCTVAKGQTLAATVIALRPDISLEVGTWGGKSLFPMALAHKEIGKGRVIAVDPWARAASKQGQIGTDAQWWGEIADHELVYQDFMRRSMDLCVSHLISVQRMISDYYNPPDGIGVLHIDGNHGPQAIKDVQRYAPQVTLGGMAFLDDLHWTGGNVLKASELIKTLGFVECYKLETGAAYQRIRR